MTTREARHAAEEAAAAAREAERLENLASGAASAHAAALILNRSLQPRGYYCITEYELADLQRLADSYTPHGTLPDGRTWRTAGRRWSSCRLYVSTK